jgi:hypothetical protein
MNAVKGSSSTCAAPLDPPNAYLLNNGISTSITVVPFSLATGFSINSGCSLTGTYTSYS